MRVLITLGVFLAVYVLFWLAATLVAPDGRSAIVLLTPYVAAIIAAVLFWRARPAPAGRHLVAGAALGFSAGFLAGFFGPMILAPEANQGPLIGILFTGPAGLAVGIAIAWWKSGRKRASRVGQP